MKITCSCGAFFSSHLSKDITGFLHAHRLCDATEPPAVTRAREILEECGIVDVQGTPADQLRPLVELVESNEKLQASADESAREIVVYIKETQRLKKLTGPPDATLTLTTSGDTKFKSFAPVLTLSDSVVYNCYRVTK